jgi:hypothetical protein
VVLVVETIDAETTTTHVPTLKKLATSYAPGAVVCGYYAYNASSSSRIARYLGCRLHPPTLTASSNHNAISCAFSPLRPSVHWLWNTASLSFARSCQQ